ncbi:MAG: GNAT family N-acetyltransferase [Pseudomonadota bacterium]
MITITPFAATDLHIAAAIWWQTGKLAYPYLPRFQALDRATALQVFTEHIANHNDIWLARLDGEAVGFIATQETYIDRLYVLPRMQGKGIGDALIEFAKRRQPSGLRLHTHQQNTSARHFYERRGFKPVKFGISPAPENVPDVEYHWQPD